MTCDLAWCTQRGRVRGWLGMQSVEFTVVRTAQGVWTLNGAVVPGLERYVDLDLGFTPATNLSQLRRVALAEGQAADVPVAWLDVSAGTLMVLPQRYERRTEVTYWYESPSANYADLLEVTPKRIHQPVSGPVGNGALTETRAAAQQYGFGRLPADRPWAPGALGFPPPALHTDTLNRCAGPSAGQRPPPCVPG